MEEGGGGGGAPAPGGEVQGRVPGDVHLVEGDALPAHLLAEPAGDSVLGSGLGWCGRSLIQKVKMVITLKSCFS